MNEQDKGASAAMLLAGTARADQPQASPEGSFPIVELRQYTLLNGQRDTLIALFEREFIESQEAVGMKVIGTFTDLDRPNRFVWLRGFRDMDSRLAGLDRFYGGPVWKAHRDAANATMIDSDNVLLLHAPHATAEFKLDGSRPVAAEDAPAGLVVATIYSLKVAPVEALSIFETAIRPRLQGAGIEPMAWFVPEAAANDFPRLPVREGERVLVWFAAFANEEDHAARRKDMDESSKPIAGLLERQPEVLRLRPTARSQLRGTPVANARNA